MDSQFNGPCNMYKVFDGGQLEFVLLAFGEGQDTTVGKIVSFQISELLVAYKERFDKDNFIKNLILDNMLLVDIYNRAKKLHIDIEARRVVMIVKFEEEKDGDEFERVRSIFGGKNKDFVTAVDETSVIVLKDLGENGTYEDIEKTAKVIIESFKDKKNEIRVSYGTIVNELKEVSRSYKEAGMALDVGKIFFDEKEIIAYSVLGIGRLIYQLPIPLCKFFENSLNVSETSRQLYIHRNTLVYRLDKLQKSTGLDLRVFEDAITFKIALMVVKYMEYMETQEF